MKYGARAVASICSGRMCGSSRMIFLFLFLFIFSFHLEPTVSSSIVNSGPNVKSATYLSPPFFLHPGLVADKYYFDIPFPRGHIGLKSFDAEVVDNAGNPVPLHETYLHHWVVEPYYAKKGHTTNSGASSGHMNPFQQPNIVAARNSGICKSLGQYYGLGSETRKTDTWVPDPYAIIVGDPEQIPDGYDEERWLLNVHAIDTRGAKDRQGCTECRCALYNVSADSQGRRIPDSYDGGLSCCYDGTQCSLREGFHTITRKLFLRYTVMWVDIIEGIIPVQIYILDVTATSSVQAPSYRRELEEGLSSNCEVEYVVKECAAEKKSDSAASCVDVKMAAMVMPHGGDVIYGVAHQHSGGTGSALYGQDGKLLCASIPTYGQGNKAGDEAGYIVGMSTCYPSPGSVRIADGEVVTLVSNYSSVQRHTGVMGLFYLLVADPVDATDLV